MVFQTSADVAVCQAGMQGYLYCKFSILTPTVPRSLPSLGPSPQIGHSHYHEVVTVA